MVSIRKALRIISISAGIVIVVSAVVIGYIYLEDVVGHTKKVIGIFLGTMFALTGKRC